MVKLKFKIESFYWDEDYTQKCKKYNIEREYSENTKFGDVLSELYKEFGIKNESRNRINYFIVDINKVMWSILFDKYIGYHIDYELEDYEKYSIGELEKQFEISKLIPKLVINLEGIGADVGRVKGIKFEFHYDEKDIHHNAHIHCTYSGTTTRVELETLRILDKPFKKSKMDIAIKIIKKNQKDLINYWNKCVINGESMKFKMTVKL